MSEQIVDYIDAVPLQRLSETEWLDFERRTDGIVTLLYDAVSECQLSRDTQVNSGVVDEAKVLLKRKRGILKVAIDYVGQYNQGHRMSVLRSYDYRHICGQAFQIRPPKGGWCV